CAPRRCAPPCPPACADANRTAASAKACLSGGRAGPQMFAARKSASTRLVLASLQGKCQPCTLRSPRSPGEAVQLKVLRDPIDDAQPFVFKGSVGPIAVAHNGNLVNAEELRASLEEQGAIFTGSSDTELLLHLIAREREGTAVERIQRALAQVRGAYSLLFLT